MAEEYLTDDEELERIKRVVADNWTWVAGGVLLGLALIFGYRYYDGYRNDAALRAAAQFDDMSAALGRNDAGSARKIAADLIKSHPDSPYADQAQLVLARLAVDDGHLGDAVAPLREVMDHSKDAELKRIARLRLARVLIAEGKPDEALQTLSQDASVAFKGLYHEIRGDAYAAKNDAKDAVAEYKAALEGGDAGNVDAALLQLKIADLGGSLNTTPAVAMAPAGAASAETAKKAKP